MALILAYWIAVASLGFGAAVSALWTSYHLQQHLRSAAASALPAPRRDLLSTNRYEMLRDSFLVAGLGTNLSLGLWTAHAGFGGVGVRIAFLLIGATLLSAFAITNYWLRHR